MKKIFISAYVRKVSQYKSEFFLRALGMTLGAIVGLAIALIAAVIHDQILGALSLSLGEVGATLFLPAAAFAGAIIGWQRSAQTPRIQALLTNTGSTPPDATTVNPAGSGVNVGSGNPKIMGVQFTMKILFLAANPSQTPPLDLEEELRSLEMELRGVTYRDSIQMTARHAVRPDDLVRYVRMEKPNVIHFSGHGSKGGIILRTDGGGFKEVDGTSLRRFLEGRGVDLVVLNACYSKEQAENLSTSVKSVVGTTDAVNDEAARRFSVAFYRTLGEGLSVSEAFRDGVDASLLNGFPDVFYTGGEKDLVFVN